MVLQTIYNTPAGCIIWLKMGYGVEWPALGLDDEYDMLRHASTVIDGLSLSGFLWQGLP
jgi:hypothetical protein